ncbi:dihydroorotate dehydrogenase [Calidifontibacter sp. DB0510]|uniref:Dihydroorotate dehydrogenase n=1 Tax=Metallococcus carri TaxID=1656884 RepID=A0A967AYF3_9MICO|nr:nitronate monooxygenase [Metallococcus carri]NHN55013.1 dihydroorotate dehydrogenase [Metallococcus carri]NOP37359.1 dihydroorotate dehydrogenase [Calidifontibacter sp. DB2511S]
MSDIGTEVEIGGLRLRVPVIGAAGCVAFGRELVRLGVQDDLGAIVTPSLTARTRAAAHRAVLREAPSGLLAPTVRPSYGVERLRPTALPWDHEGVPPVIVSLAGNTSGDFAEVASGLRRGSLMRRVAGVEIQLASVDAKNSHRPFAYDEFGATKVVARVRESVPSGVPIFAKLCADVTDLVEVARGCVKAGASALVVTSPVRGLLLDPATLRPVIDPASSGLSGPALLPITLRAVWDLRAAVRSGRLPPIPLVAVGGIRSGQDAAAALAAGASAVQLGTALLHDPDAAAAVVAGLVEAVRERGFDHVLDLIGIAHDH